MTESETPLAFLARHSGASEAELGPGLASAAALYRESERMIANRLLALWLEKGEEERQEEGFQALLAGFAHGKRGEVQSIGAVIQHYRMLRGQGYGHEAALDFAMGRKDAP